MWIENVHDVMMGGVRRKEREKTKKERRRVKGKGEELTSNAHHAKTYATQKV